jgi:transcription initiation factor TFIID TATA-box-binding protein
MNRSIEQLRDEGISVANMVGTLNLEREFDLETLAADLRFTKYDPKSSPFMTYKPAKQGTCLVPSNGSISIVGVKNSQEMTAIADDFLDKISKLSIAVERSSDDIILQNIVATIDLEVKIDLNTAAFLFGLDRTEYEPEQFPGLIYRTEVGTTVLVFGSGKVVITGARGHTQVLESARHITEALVDRNIEMR